MTVQTKNIQEAAIVNAKYILDRIIWNDDKIQFLEEGDTRAVEGLVMATTKTGMMFVFPVVWGRLHPHDIEIHEGGKLVVNTATARHDLSKYRCREIALLEVLTI